MVVVVIIGLLLAVAIPSFNAVRKNARFSAFMNDVRMFKDSIEFFYLENGVLPNDSSTGTLDPQLDPYIDAAVFERTTPIGGSWDVEADDSGVTLAVGAVNHILSTQDLNDIDAKFDDGNLATGNLRQVASGRYYYILED